MQEEVANQVKSAQDLTLKIQNQSHGLDPKDDLAKSLPPTEMK